MTRSSSPKRFVVGINVLIQLILGAVIAVFLNLGIHRWHPPRVDLSRNDYYKLSDKTLQLLKSIPADMEVIVFFQPESDSAWTQRVYEDIQVLLKEYESACPKLKVRFVDPDRDPAGADRLSKKFNVKIPNVVVFAYKDDRSKFVPVGDMVEFDRSGYPMHQTDKIKAFKGEQMFTSAIQSVLDPRRPKVYFLEGHSEGDPENNTPREGFSTIAAYLRRDNLQVEKFTILQKPIPSDCDILIICGPEKPFSETEIQAIEQYLAQNGRLMLLLDGLKYDTGLEKLLLDHGVKADNDVVLLKIDNRLGGEALVMAAPGSSYGAHPISESLRKEDVVTLFPVARSIDRAPSAAPGKERVTVLVSTPEEAWGETDLLKLQQEKAQLDESDRKGPVPLAVAVEPNTAGEMEREGMRMVVFGSSSFARNGSLKGGNMDLFLNSINWLLKREQLIGIAPKTPNEFALILDVNERRAISTTEIVLIPLAVAVIGCFVWFKRRK